MTCCCLEIVDYHKLLPELNGSLKVTQFSKSVVQYTRSTMAETERVAMILLSITLRITLSYFLLLKIRLRLKSTVEEVSP